MCTRSLILVCFNNNFRIKSLLVSLVMPVKAPLPVNQLTGKKIVNSNTHTLSLLFLKIHSFFPHLPLDFYTSASLLHPYMFPPPILSLNFNVSLMNNQRNKMPIPANEECLIVLNKDTYTSKLHLPVYPRNWGKKCHFFRNKSCLYPINGSLRS